MKKCEGYILKYFLKQLKYEKIEIEYSNFSHTEIFLMNIYLCLNIF